MSEPTILNKVDAQFMDAYRWAIENGHLKEDRTAVGTISTHATVMRFDCSNGQAPIISVRGIMPEKFQHEMHWFVSGNPSIKYLRDNKVGIWDSWFIKGTDRYDAPKKRTLTTQERINLICKTQEIQEAVTAKLINRLDVSGLGGPHSIKMIEGRGKVVSHSNFAWQDLVEIDKFLDQYNPVREVEVWEGVPGDTLTTQERIDLALEMHQEYMVVPFLHGFHPSGDGVPYENLSFHHMNIKEGYGFDKVQVDAFNDILDYSGVPRRRNVPKKISLKRRLARVSKNDIEKWDRINRRIYMLGYEMVIDKDYGPEIPVTVFKDGKFQDDTLHPVLAELVANLLDHMGVSAWPLVDANIGYGGYGPNWRHWQDTQLVSAASDTFPGYKEYLNQGYKLVGGVQLENTTLGHHVMHREIDQLQNAIDKLKSNPDDRRIIVLGWNPGRIWQAALPPCHLYFQLTTRLLTVEEFDVMFERNGIVKEFDEKFLDEMGDKVVARVDYVNYCVKFCKERNLPHRALNMFVLLRSSDLPLGAVFNVAQYGYLLHMIAHVTNMETAELVTVGVDAHIYLNQVDVVKEMLGMDSTPGSDPRISFKRQCENIDDIKFEDVEIAGYLPGPFMDIPVAV